MEVHKEVAEHQQGEAEEWSIGEHAPPIARHGALDIGSRCGIRVIRPLNAGEFRMGNTAFVFMAHRTWHRYSNPQMPHLAEERNQQYRDGYHHRRFNVEHQRIRDLDQLVGHNRSNRVPKINRPRLQYVCTLLTFGRHHIRDIRGDGRAGQRGERTIDEQSRA